MRSRLNRREILEAVGAAAALAPFVPVLEARAAGPYKRLIVFFSSQGVIREKYVPSTSGGELALSEILAPLEPHRKEILVLDGIGHHAALYYPNHKPHENGGNVCLSGARAKMRPGDPVNVSFSSGISLEQHLANQIGSTTRFRTLECGVTVPTYSLTYSCISYAGPDRPIMPESDPYKVYARLFGDALAPAGGGTADLAAERLRADRRSAVDFVRAELGALRARIGVEERRKVDAHLEAIREIERTLAAPPAAAGRCAVPAEGTRIDPRAHENTPIVSKLQMDILTAAMACDLVRVGTIQQANPGSHNRMPWLGAEFALQEKDLAGLHSIAHRELQTTYRALKTRAHVWFASQLSYLIARLKAVPEGTGTMLDSTLVLWMSEMSNGVHNDGKEWRNCPFVLAGGPGGPIRMGRLLTFDDQPANRLYLAILHAFGLADTKFGEAELSARGPLAGLS